MGWLNSARKPAALGAAGLALALAVPGGAQAAALVQTSVPLNIGGYADMVVDKATGHIFISSGIGSTAITVANLNGQVIGTIPGQAGAFGLALNASGSTLYAALSDGHAVSAINAATLQPTRVYPTGSAWSPTYVAIADGTLWFTDSQNAEIREINLGTGSTYSTSVNAVSIDAMIATSPYDTNLLVTGETSQEPAAVFEDTASNGVLKQGAELITPTSDECSFMRDLAFTPDGKDVLVNCGAPYQATAIDLKTSAVDENYQVPPYADSVAVAGDGTIAVAHAFYPSAIDLFKPGVTTAQASYQITGTASATPTIPGVGFGVDSSHFYAVTSDFNGQTTSYTLNTFAP